MYSMLTDAHCRNAICPPDSKQARFTDAGGLYLQVSPSGSKRWFYKYRTDGKEKQLALGSYPAVGLTAAAKRVMLPRCNVLRAATLSRPVSWKSSEAGLLTVHCFSIKRLLCSDCCTS